MAKSLALELQELFPFSLLPMLAFSFSFVVFQGGLISPYMLNQKENSRHKNKQLSLIQLINHCNLYVLSYSKLTAVFIHSEIVN